MWKSGSYLQINESYDIPLDWLEPAHDDQYGQELYLKSDSLSLLSAVEMGRL